MWVLQGWSYVPFAGFISILWSVIKVRVHTAALYTPPLLHEVTICAVNAPTGACPWKSRKMQKTNTKLQEGRNHVKIGHVGVHSSAIWKIPHQFKIKLLAPKHPTSLGRERGVQGNSRTHWAQLVLLKNTIMVSRKESRVISNYSET